MKTLFTTLILTLFVSLTSLAELVKYEIKNLSNPNAISNKVTESFEFLSGYHFNLEVKLGDKIQVTCLMSDVVYCVNSVNLMNINTVIGGINTDGKSYTIIFDINSVNINKVMLIFGSNASTFYINTHFVTEYTKDTNSGGGSSGSGGGGSTTGLTENSLSSGLQIYPNPATDHVTVTVSNFKLQELKVYDMSGRCVQTHQISNGQQEIEINLSKESKGTYYIPYEEGKAPFKFEKI